MALLVVHVIAAALVGITSCCNLCGTPDISDTSTSIDCINSASIINGIKGKNVSQCHGVAIRKRPVLNCKVKANYDSSNDQLLLQHTGSNYIAYSIFSPGYFNNQCYDKKIFCAYNIKCPPNHFLYYNFVTHDIEDPTSQGTCLDSITLSSDSTPFNQVTPTCGRVGCSGTFADFGITQQGYESQNLRVQFRSNKKCTASGYFLWVYCIDNNNQNVPNCNGPLSNSLNLNSTPPPVKRRRKISNEEHYTVPFGGTLSYSGHKLYLTVYEEESKLIKEGIYKLDVISGPNTKSYEHSKESVTFYGEGELIVFSNFAEYHIIGVPQSYKLTGEESYEVNKLLTVAVKYFNSNTTDYTVIDDDDDIWDHCDTNDTHYITPTSTSKYASTSTSAEQIKTTSTVSKVSKPIIGIETPVLCKEPYKFPYICFKQKLMDDDKLLELASKFTKSCKAILRSVGDFFVQLKNNKLYI